MAQIDINCDMGESFGPWQMGNDAAVIEWVSSVNIACGFHAGDPGTMRKTIQMAAEKNVAVGAHPGFPDLQGFGRRNMSLGSEEIYDLVLYQAGALQGMAAAAGTRLHHVKPHGALYNLAAVSEKTAMAVIRAVKDLDSALILYGLAGSMFIRLANEAGIKTAEEVFADRSYEDNGTLTPRSEEGAVISNPLKMAERALNIINKKMITSRTGKIVPVRPDTLCIHGDGLSAAESAKMIYETLTNAGVNIRPVGKSE